MIITTFRNYAPIFIYNDINYLQNKILVLVIEAPTTLFVPKISVNSMKIMREWIKIEILTPINTRTVTYPTIHNNKYEYAHEIRKASRTYLYLSTNGEGGLQIN